MRLAFELPAGWTADRTGDRVTVRHGAFGSHIEAAPLAPKGFDPRLVIEAGLPAGARVEYVQILEPLVTRDGWRMKLATLELHHGATRLETRIAATYELTHYLGIAVAHLVMPADREAIVAILGSARPLLWPDEAVCIGELWTMESP